MVACNDKKMHTNFKYWGEKKKEIVVNYAAFHHLKFFFPIAALRNSVNEI